MADEEETQGTIDAGQRDDWIFTTRLRIDYDRRFGTHKLSLHAMPDYVNYAKFSQFDHVAQQAGGNWAGQVGSDGYYVFDYYHRRAAGNPADQAEPTLNLITTNLLTGDLLIRTGQYWQGIAGMRLARNRNSAEFEKGGDNDGWGADLGMRFAPGTGSTVESRYRHSRFRYPEVIPSLFSDNSYKQEEVLLSVNWEPSAASRFEGRASYMWREHDNFQERDFEGWAGSFRYHWRPRVATSLAATIYKELGAINDASASYARTYGARLEPLWDVDAKITLRGRLEWRDRRYEGFSSFSKPDEKTSVVGLGVDYRPSLPWLMRFGLNQERRLSDDPYNGYSVWVATLNLIWQMQ